MTILLGNLNGMIRVIEKLGQIENEKELIIVMNLERDVNYTFKFDKKPLSFM